MAFDLVAARRCNCESNRNVATNSPVSLRLFFLLAPGCVWISDKEYTDRLALADGDTDTDCTLMTWFHDVDGDGYGSPSDTIDACVLPDGYVSNDADCDDSDADLNPKTTWFLDGDGDGYGDGATTAASCEKPDGYVVDDTDCDDILPGVNPGAQEDCDTSQDDDCDGEANTPDALNCASWYTDADADGHGAGAPTDCVCAQPAGTAASDGDCDDTSSDVSPDIAERCDDGLDNDCDGGPADACLLAASLAVDTDTTGVLRGTDRNGLLGLSMAVGADLLGDGLVGVAISASRAETGEADAGAVYLHSGPITADGSIGGPRVTGVVAEERLGFSVAAGDLDGDGNADLIAGAPSTGAGSVYVFAGPITADRDAGAADATITGASSDDRAGYGVAVSDVDGDGVEDLLLGAYASDTVGTAAGAVYLFSGPVSSGTSLSDASTLLGEVGGDRAGIVLSAAGDVDGDGLDDLLVGADKHSPSGGLRAGAVYLVQGSTSSGSLGDVDWIVSGDAADLRLGSALAPAGDVDGDGYDEVLMGCPTASTVYVVGWSADGTYTVGAVAEATVVGDSGSGLGQSMVSAGDIDGDGAVDIAVGAPLAGGGSGEVWLLYGPLSGTIASGDVVVGDAPSDASLGYGLAAPGDISGDARPDLLLGAPNDDGDGQRGGSVWALAGGGL